MSESQNILVAAHAEFFKKRAQVGYRVSQAFRSLTSVTFLSKGQQFLRLDKLVAQVLVPGPHRDDIYCVGGRYVPAANTVEFDDIRMRHDWQQPLLTEESRELRHREAARRLRADGNHCEWVQLGLVASAALMEAAQENVAVPLAPEMPRFMLGFRDKNLIPFTVTDTLIEEAAKAAGITPAAITAMEEQPRIDMLKEVFAGFIVDAALPVNPTRRYLIDHVLLGDTNMTGKLSGVWADLRALQGAKLPNFAASSTYEIPNAVDTFVIIKGYERWANWKSIRDLAQEPKAEILSQDSATILEEWQAARAVVNEVAGAYHRECCSFFTREAVHEAVFNNAPVIRTMVCGIGPREEYVAALAEHYPPYSFTAADINAGLKQAGEPITASRGCITQVISRQPALGFIDSLTFGPQQLGHANVHAVLVQTAQSPRKPKKPSNRGSRRARHSQRPGALPEVRQRSESAAPNAEIG